MKSQLESPNEMLEKAKMLLEQKEWRACIELLGTRSSYTAISNIRSSTRETCIKDGLTSTNGGTTSGSSTLVDEGTTFVACTSKNGSTASDPCTIPCASSLIKEISGNGIHSDGPPRVTEDSLLAMQVEAVADIHHYSRERSWLRVLRLPANTQGSGLNNNRLGNSQAAVVRRQYRRLAALVHPDKCGLPHAASAFQLLGQAQQHILQLNGSKRKYSSCNEQPYETDMEEDSAPVEEGFEWWGAWQEHKVQHKGRHSGQACEAQMSTEPSTAELEDPELWSLSIEALRSEVAERQRSVLNPVPTQDKTGGNSIQERQRKLRSARHILSERLKAASQVHGSGYDLYL